MNQRHPIDWKRYILAFIITGLIFGSALYVNKIIDEKREGNINAIRDQIALDLLSSETQFNLLRETSCTNISTTALSEELNSLSRKLSYMEADDANGNNPELVYLKKYYSLLEIKDYLLMDQLRIKCGLKPLSILYFYGKKDDCPECEKVQVVLTYLRQQYPELRVYSFDTGLEMSALDTLKSMFKVEDTKLPALVINNKQYTGFKTVEEMKVLIPELKTIDAKRLEDANSNATSTATSTPATKKPRTTRKPASSATIVTPQPTATNTSTSTR